MSIHKLERVLWRLRKICPNNDNPPWIELKRAIMYECGTDPITYKNNKSSLIALGWIIHGRGKTLKLTNKDLTDS